MINNGLVGTSAAMKEHLDISNKAPLCSPRGYNSLQNELYMQRRVEIMFDRLGYDVRLLRRQETLKGRCELCHMIRLHTKCFCKFVCCQKAFY